MIDCFKVEVTRNVA